MRKATFKGYTYFITEDGKHFYNSKGEERPIQTNKKRQNRRYIKLNQNSHFLNVLVAYAFPEICGEWFEDCDVHHIDGDQTNDNATNLKVMTKEEHKRIHFGMIVKYALNGEKVGEYYNSFEAAASLLPQKITPASIRECLCGKSKTCGGFLWRREK